MRKKLPLILTLTLTQVLKKLPALLLESDILVTAFHCGCAGLHVKHREAEP